MTFNLHNTIIDKVITLGDERAAEYFGKTANTIGKWKSGTMFPSAMDAQLVLDEALSGGLLSIPSQEVKPPPQVSTKPPEDKPVVIVHEKNVGEVTQDEKKVMMGPELKAIAEKARKFSILLPAHRDYPPDVLLSILGQWKATLPHELREHLASADLQYDSLIHRSRNHLATRFLATGNEWSLWMDSDILASFGNAQWFKRKTGHKIASDKWFQAPAIERLTKHGKTIVSAVYTQRYHDGKLVNQPALAPKNKTDEETVKEIRRGGPQDKIIPVDWTGFGCIAVHRRVFEDILRTQPEIASVKEGEPHGFFIAFENGPQGEDVAFMKRAKKCGHQCYLDLGCFVAHVGRAAFLP